MPMSNNFINVVPQFINEDKEKEHILTLSGVVSNGGFFSGQTINATDIRNALDDVDKDIVIRLNSGGGDVFQGVEIYNYLKALDNHVTIEVTALAASAASLITMAADKIIIRTGASMMVHEASTIAFGNKNDIQKTLNALNAIDDSIIDIYAERTNIDNDELIEMVKNETWLTADQAVKKGFADEKSSKKAVKEKAEKGGVENMDQEKFIALLKEQRRALNTMIKNEDEDLDPDEESETLEEKVDEVLEKINDIDERVKELEKDSNDDDQDDDDDQGQQNEPQNAARKLYF